MPTARETEADSAFGGMIEKDNQQTDFQLSPRKKRSRFAGPLYNHATNAPEPFLFDTLYFAKSFVFDPGFHN
jgi:hypothetical protein